MNRRITKKNMLIKEFVDNNGGLVSKKVPLPSNDEVESDITTDNFLNKTRQGVTGNGSPGSRYGASFGMVQETEDIQSAVLNAANELKTAIETSQMDENSVKKLLSDLYQNIEWQTKN